MKLLLPLLLLFSLGCSVQDTEDKGRFRFNHVMLYVDDIDRSVNFYTSVFPLTEENRVNELRVVTEEGTDTIPVKIALLRFSDQDFVLEISEQPDRPAKDQPSPSYQHIGVNVRDIDAMEARLVAGGAELISPVREINANTIEAKISFYRGPDGEIIELMQLIEGMF